MAVMEKIRTESEIEKFVHNLHSLKEVVSEFLDLTGVVVVATIGNVKSERAVRYWRSGEKPSEREPQLRFGLRLAVMIAQHAGRGVTQAWFKGSNTMLNDRSPAALLRDDFSEETQKRLLAAAREITA